MADKAHAPDHARLRHRGRGPQALRGDPRRVSCSVGRCSTDGRPTPRPGPPTSTATRRSFRCDRCGCEKVQRLDEYGHQISSNIAYPEGYVSDVGRIAGSARDAMRLTSLTRQITRYGQVADPAHNVSQLRDRARRAS